MSYASEQGVTNAQFNTELLRQQAAEMDIEAAKMRLELARTQLEEWKRTHPAPFSSTTPPASASSAVGECVEAFEKVRQEHLYRSAWIDPNSLGELHAEAREKGIAAVHSLLVSRLTGAATRSETELRKAAAHAYEALEQLKPCGHDGDEESGQCDEDCDRCACDGAIAHLADALASHPASVEKL